MNRTLSSLAIGFHICRPDMVQCHQLLRDTNRRNTVAIFAENHKGNPGYPNGQAYLVRIGIRLVVSPAATIRPREIHTQRVQSDQNRLHSGIEDGIAFISLFLDHECRALFSDRINPQQPCLAIS
jgi:hypothetical protein